MGHVDNRHTLKGKKDLFYLYEPVISSTYMV